MNKITHLLPLLMIFMLGCTQVQEQTTTVPTTVSESISQTNSVANVSPNASTIPTTSTTSTTSIASITSTIISTTTTINEEVIECVDFCKSEGYLGGECHVNQFDCFRRNEVKPRYTGRLCKDRRYDTCCCMTNESVQFNTCFVFNEGMTFP